MRRDATPVMIRHDGQRETLERLPLRPATDDATKIREDWVQKLIWDVPDLLPVEQIEPGFGTLVPICMELPLPAGLVDNLYMTPKGRICLVEAKLWRNNQSRRAVVAQAMDYVASLSRLSYDEFEAAVRTARRAQRLEDAEAGLFALVAARAAGEEQPDEAEFIDAVARNLRLGRMLALVCGDGIQESAELLAGLLQSHAGHRFTFGLVELSIWEAPTGRIVIPSILAKTTLIERGVVRIDGETGRIAVSVPASVAEKGGAAPRGKTLTEDELLEALDGACTGMGDRLSRFRDDLRARGFEPKIGNTMLLRYADRDGVLYGAGTVQRSGHVTLSFGYGEKKRMTNDAHLVALRRYVSALADAIGGTPSETGDWLTLKGPDGKTPRLGDLLDHQEAWIAALVRLQEEVQAAGEAS